MLFLVDGYNITKGDPATAALGLEAQRDALVARLRARGADVLGRGRIVVFFDGEASVPQAGVARADTYPVEVVYSRGTSADDSIVARAAREVGGLLCVVTSDAELAGRVRSAVGADVDVRPRETLYEAAPRRVKTRRRAGVPREAGLPPGANAITKELKDLWLGGQDGED